jgi:predicted MFS family arabinose efflux permease
MKPDSGRWAGLPSRFPTAVCLLAMMEVAVEMGIGRFAFTPMLPLMIGDGLLDTGEGAWLASGNYLGYLLGALTVSRVRVPSKVLLPVSLAGIVVVTAAMGVGDGGMAAWFVLRFAAGGLSAWAFVLTNAWALERLARARRPDLAGVVYAGVGVGIASVGAFCVVAAGPGVPAQWLWLGLGALSATAIVPPLLRRGGPRDIAVSADQKLSTPADSKGSASLVICYGLVGFGYILPATFLPALARTVVDDPRIFGLAWPVFGIAAALSTILGARTIRRMNRLRVWAVCHLVMAAGVVMPSLWLSPTSIAIAALLVGGTYLVPAMIGMQEARARASGDPTALLGRMTAAFAIGQIGGPVVSATLGMLPAGQAAGLDLAFQAAAVVLVLSAAHLFRLARHQPVET